MAKKKEEVIETPVEITEETEATQETPAPTEPETTETNAAETKAVKEKKTDKPETKKKAARSTKHQAASSQVDKNKQYALTEAIDLVKKTSYSKFDGSIDVHINLTPSKKADEVVRGTVTLPHGTGKERRVVVITEDMVAKIEQGWLDFDVAVTTPDMMPKIAKLAKVLGPKGLMPNPKSGTVTTEPEKVVAELKGGRVEFKADALGNIHQSIGRVSWDNEKLTENFNTFVAALPKTRIRNLTLAPTMGPGVRINVTS